MGFLTLDDGNTSSTFNYSALSSDLQSGFRDAAYHFNYPGDPDKDDMSDIILFLSSYLGELLEEAGALGSYKKAILGIKKSEEENVSKFSIVVEP